MGGQRWRLHNTTEVPCSGRYSVDKKLNSDADKRSKTDVVHNQTGNCSKQYLRIT